MPLVQQSANFAPSSAQDTEADAHPKGRADSNFDVDGAKPIPPTMGANPAQVAHLNCVRWRCAMRLNST